MIYDPNWGGKRKGAGAPKGATKGIPRPNSGRKRLNIKLRRGNNYQVVDGEHNAEVWTIIDVKADGLTFEKPNGELVTIKTVD
jgi:hypothetical protein